MRDKRDRVIVCVFRRDLHLTLMFSGLLQKRSVWSLGFSVWGNFFFKKNCCHPCHTGFAVFFNLPSCCGRGEEKGVYVVVQLYPWYKFHFPLFQTHYHSLP